MDSIPSRFQGIVIPKDDPFKNDKLGYSKYSSVLKGMVDMYKDSGCVIAINGKWGTGKTTFIRMWEASLPKKEYNTIYFNAWETDYFADPLVAIMGELKAISQDDEAFKKVASSLGKILTAASSAALRGVIKKTTGVDSAEIGEAIGEVKSSINGALDKYQEQKQSLEEFKLKLSEYVAGQNGKPVVFIIDELDRCNPHYAVRVLEIVKHLFDVPNICFFLTIDKSQLECSIKGFYGNSEIDAENYLRRFIDIDFRMPEPYIEGFTELLFDHYGFQQFFYDISEDTYHTPVDFRDMATALCKLYRIDLRTYDKILAHTRLSLMQLRNDTIILDVVLLLCFIRVADSAFFDAISHHDFSMNELLAEFEKRFPRTLLSQDDFGSPSDRLAHKVVYLLGPFLLLYNRKGSSTIEDGFTNLNKDTSLPLNCQVIEPSALLDAMIWFTRCSNLHFGMDNVLKTVNLLRNFQ